MTIVICLYLIVGIITIVPCIVYGFVRDIDAVEEFEDIDGWGAIRDRMRISFSDYNLAVLYGLFYLCNDCQKT